MGRLALAGIALLLASCSTLNLEVGEGVDRGRVEAFEVGRTRRAEVLAALGPPTEIASHAGGVAFLYQKVRLKERQLGLGLDDVGRLVGLPWLALVKLSFGRSSAHHDAALLVFDSESVLRGASHLTWDESFGRGASLQFLFAVQQVVDAGTLRADPPALVWGRGALDPLPRSLNQAGSADLELRGTGVKAGQESVEMLEYSAKKRR